MSICQSATDSVQVSRLYSGYGSTVVYCTDPHNYFLGFKRIQINYFGHVILSDLEPFPFKHLF